MTYTPNFEITGTILPGFLHGDLYYNSMGTYYRPPRIEGSLGNFNPEELLRATYAYRDEPLYADPFYPKQVKERFTEEAVEKSWNLVKEFLTKDQWIAFNHFHLMIELENITKTHRLLIAQNGKFTVLNGSTGEGYVEMQGKVHESNYPLGDEMAALIALFKYDVNELMRVWRCGNFTSRNETSKTIEQPQLEEYAEVFIRDKDTVKEPEATTLFNRFIDRVKEVIM